MINRVASRMGLTRLTFSPYTHQQLSEIVASRLTGKRKQECNGLHYYKVLNKTLI